MNQNSHQQQQQQQQQSLSAVSEQPRWLGGAAGTWRARASPPPWLGSGAAMFKDASLGQLPLSKPIGAGRPVTAVHHQHQQQRPLGAVRAVSAHGAARRRARGHNRRTPTPEPPAGQGGYLAPSRGGRVTPQMAVAAASSSMSTSLAPLPPVSTQSLQQPPPPLLPSMEAEASTTAHHTVVVRGRSGRRGSRTNASASSVASAVPADIDSANSATAAATSKQNGEHQISESVAVSTNGLNTGSPPLANGNDLNGAAAKTTLKTSQPPPPAQPILQPTPPAAMAANGSVTSISYMHFLNGQPDQNHSHQQQPLPLTPASPRPRPPPMYTQTEPSTIAVTAPTLTTAATATSSTTTSSTTATSTTSDSQQPKPLVSITDGTGCTTEIYPIKSILKKAAAAAAAANGQQLSAAVRPKTAVGFGLKSQQPSPAPAAQQPQTSTPSEDQPMPASPAPRRPTVRRAATMQSGKLSLRARSQSAGPRRGVRFDMTSNSVHEYEPAPLVTQQANVPAFTADTEHWYRLMWRRLAEH